MNDTTINRRIFYKGTFHLEKNITVECANGYTMTVEEFKSVIKQIQQSSMSYSCNPMYVSADKAKYLCTIAQYSCAYAYDYIQLHAGTDWLYTGD